MHSIRTSHMILIPGTTSRTTTKKRKRRIKLPHRRMSILKMYNLTLLTYLPALYWRLIGLGRDDRQMSSTQTILNILAGLPKVNTEKKEIKIDRRSGDDGRRQWMQIDMNSMLGAREIIYGQSSEMRMKARERIKWKEKKTVAHTADIIAALSARTRRTTQHHIICIISLHSTQLQIN